MDLDADGIDDITWFGTDNRRPDWDDPELRTLCYQLDGSEEGSDRGDYQLFFILNADYRKQSVELPHAPEGKIWYRVIDTSLESGKDFLEPGAEVPIDPANSYPAAPRSTVVLLGR